MTGDRIDIIIDGNCGLIATDVVLPFQMQLFKNAFILIQSFYFF